MLIQSWACSLPSTSAIRVIEGERLLLAVPESDASPILVEVHGIIRKHQRAGLRQLDLQ
jgi:hypothetical protein